MMPSGNSPPISPSPKLSPNLYALNTNLLKNKMTEGLALLRSAQEHLNLGNCIQALDDCNGAKESFEKSMFYTISRLGLIRG